MKTSTHHFEVHTIFAVFAVVGIFVCVPSHAERAEKTDAEFVQTLRERKTDFDVYIEGRKKAASHDHAVAEKLRKQREDYRREFAQWEAEYQRNLKRYSMEEQEARDREGEALLKKEDGEMDLARMRFVSVRDRQKEIESSMNGIDSYLEFDIDMNVAPDSKISGAPGSSSGQEQPQ